MEATRVTIDEIRERGRGGAVFFFFEGLNFQAGGKRKQAGRGDTRTPRGEIKKQHPKKNKKKNKK